MKSIFKFAAVFVISVFFLLNSFKLLADDETPGGHPSDWASGERSYRYGIVHNKNSYPVRFRLNGSNELRTLPAGQMMVVPIGTTTVEVQPHPDIPLSGSERLNVEVRVGDIHTRTATRVPGYGDTVRLEEATGGFRARDMRADMPVLRVMDGACYSEDRETLNLRRLNHSDEWVRIKGMEELAEMKSRRAVEPLMELLERDSESLVRSNAAEALGDIGDERAVGLLRRKLTTGEGAVPYESCMALGSIGGEEARNALAELLRTSSSPEVRSHAIWALERIGTEEAASVIRGAMRDSSSSVRGSAVEALGNIGDSECIPDLQAALRDSDHNVRRDAASALGKIGGEESIGVLSQALRDNDRYVRLAAGTAMERIGGQNAVNALKEALGDDSEEVRLQALTSLGNIKTESARKAVEAGLGDDSERIRTQAAHVLGEMGDARAVDALSKALTDESSRVRDYAARALGKIGGEDAANALETVLNDGDANVRANARIALRRIQERQREKEMLREKARILSRNETLMELNETYMEDMETLPKLDPNSEEAKARRRRLKITEEQIRDLIKQEENKHGSGWIERYREADGKLPGGLIEDSRSRYAKLQDLRTAQATKVRELEERFERLKRETRPSTETLQERLKRERDAFREEFIRENGPPETWDEETRRRYERGYNAIAEEVRRRWDEEQRQLAQKNRELGRTIRELAIARNDLKETDARIRRAKSQIAREAEQEKEVAAGQAEKTGKTGETGAGTDTIQKIPEGASLEGPSGAKVVKIAGYAVDYTDETIGFWNSEYPHLSFDDEQGRRGLPNGVWDGSYYFKNNMLHLVIDNLNAPYPPLHTLGIGYTVTLEGATFEDGSNTKNLILYRYSGTPDKTRIVQSFRIIPITRGDER